MAAEGSSDMPEGKSKSNVPAASIHWFRHGLRLHDNPALLEALTGCGEFYPVFIFDGKVAGTDTAGYNRFRFILECLKDLDTSLKEFGGRLYCFFGEPTKVFENLFREWGVTKLTFQQDSEPVWQRRDDAVKALCKEKDVECIERVSHSLWDPKEIIKMNGGSPPLTYSLFNQVAAAVGPPPRPVPTPDFRHIKLPVEGNHDEKFGIPSLDKLGIFPEMEEQNRRVNEWKGGETHALDLLKKRLLVEEMAFRTGSMLPNQAYPDLVGPPLSMSAHLRMGCMSIRKFFWDVHDTYSKVNPGKEPPMAITGQLMWREYFYTMSVNNPKYNVMENNPICLNIPWYDDAEKLKKWTEGKTGFPWIDAIMTQLHHEGWIHHVARHAVSTFLTRGDLWISWEEGQKVFDRLQLDADWSVLAGNWMWMSSSAFEKVFQCPKCFCPVRYGRRMDPKGEYIRRYLPVLKHMPLRYLFEPWKAPKSVQEKAKCIVGVDYPHPMVDHASAAKHCYRLMEDVKNKINKDTPHIGPASLEEVSQFVWLPMDHMEEKKPKRASKVDQLCDGFMEL